MREFTIVSLNRRGFIIFLSTMADTKDIQDGIIEKLSKIKIHRKIQNIVGNPCKGRFPKLGKFTIH